ncbi:MAG TPA: hypothetical protein VGH47_04530 [Xanthobacteraceae bacterium]|jgi:hypothetical protein
MALGGIILGLINIVIVIVILLLIGACIAWVMSTIGWPVPQMVQQLFLALVMLVAVYLLVALLLGLPGVRLIGSLEGQPQTLVRYSLASLSS